MKKIIALISTAILLLMTHNVEVMGQAGNYNQVIEKLSANLAEGLIKKGKKAITIADFDNKDGSISELGQDIADDMEIALLSPKYDFTIVTRKELDRVLEEQKISRNELTSSENVIKLGQIKNVQALVIGTLTDWNDEIRVMVQVIDVEEGVKIVGVADNITKFGTIQAKFNKIVSPGKDIKNPNQEEYNRLLADANNLFLLENYSEALKLYEQAKVLVPENTASEEGIKACKQKIADKAAREQDAREERSWANAKAYNTVEAYKEYQSKYPSGKYFDAANMEIKRLRENEKKQQDGIAWQKAQQIHSIEGYQNYQKEFPFGDHYTEAYSQINKIRTEDSNEWERAKRTNTINSYQEYLNQYPTGTYVSSAKQEMEKLQRASTVNYALIATWASQDAKKWSDWPFYGSRATAFADVTGDGKADVIAVNDNWVTVRRSGGSSFLSHEAWTSNPYWGSLGNYFADVTGDGKADAIVVNDMSITVRRSDGIQFLPNEDWTTNPYSGSLGNYFADVTGDGKADAIVVNDMSITVRRSDGIQFLPNEDWTTNPYSGSRGNYFADVTGDGKADAIVVNDMSITVRRSDGTQFLPNEDWTTNPYLGSLGNYFADVTGDGKADAIVVNDSKITVRRSDGIQFLPNEDWTNYTFYGSKGTYFADVTGDRKVDAIAVNDENILIRVTEK